MAAVPSFIFGGGAPAKTPQEAARNRAVYESIVARMSSAPRNVGEGLSSVGNALVARSMMDRAAQGEEAGQATVAEMFAGLQDGADQSELLSLIGNEWASPQQTAVAQALMNRQFAAEDRQIDWGRQDELRAEDRSYDVQDRDLGWGREDDFRSDAWAREDAQRAEERAWTVEDTAAAAAAKAAPAAAKEAVAEGRRETATDTIVGAASRARELAANEGNLGLSGKAWAVKPDSEAAELRRQVHVLQSQASIENLTAMRQASPTGGALGSVSEKENAMLAAASGAIDPDAAPEDFNRQLDNYERTLLRIVHGPAEGDRLFAETRNQGGSDADGLAPGAIEDGFRFKGGDPSDPNNWEKV